MALDSTASVVLDLFKWWRIYSVMHASLRSRPNDEEHERTGELMFIYLQMKACQVRMWTMSNICRHFKEVHIDHKSCPSSIEDFQQRTVLCKYSARHQLFEKILNIKPLHGMCHIYRVCLSECV